MEEKGYRTDFPLAGKAPCPGLSGACHILCHRVPGLRDDLGVVRGRRNGSRDEVRLAGLNTAVPGASGFRFGTGLIRGIWSWEHIFWDFLKSLFIPHPWIFAILEKG